MTVPQQPRAVPGAPRKITPVITQSVAAAAPPQMESILITDGQAYEDLDDIVGNGECVTYVKTAGKIMAQTTQWRAGDKVKDAPNLKSGTVIMTADKNGHYPSGSAAKHAAEFIRHLPGGIEVRDQWAKRFNPDGSLRREQKSVGKRSIRYKNGVGSAVDDADQYFVVLVPKR